MTKEDMAPAYEAVAKLIGEYEKLQAENAKLRKAITDMMDPKINTVVAVSLENAALKNSLIDAQTEMDLRGERVQRLESAIEKAREWVEKAQSWTRHTDMYFVALNMVRRNLNEVLAIPEFLRKEIPTQAEGNDIHAAAVKHFSDTIRDTPMNKAEVKSMFSPLDKNEPKSGTEFTMRRGRPDDFPPQYSVVIVEEKHMFSFNNSVIGFYYYDENNRLSWRPGILAPATAPSVGAP